MAVGLITRPIGRNSGKKASQISGQGRWQLDLGLGLPGTAESVIMRPVRFRHQAAAACPMSPQSPHPIKPGIRFRDGKLYLFARSGIIVLRQWPDLRAWRKTPKARSWRPIRPALHLEPCAEGWTCRVEPREQRVRAVTGGTSIRLRLEREPEAEDWDPFDPGPFDEFAAGDPEAPDHEPAVEPDSATPAVALPGTGDGESRRQWSELRRVAFLQPIPDEVLAAVAPFACRHWHLLNLIARCPGALDLVRSTPALAFALASPWVFRRPAPTQPLRSARALLRRPQHEIAGWLGAKPISRRCVTAMVWARKPSACCC
jgi:hypothetical protein